MDNPISTRSMLIYFLINISELMKEAGTQEFWVDEANGIAHSEILLTRVQAWKH